MMLSCASGFPIVWVRESGAGVLDAFVVGDYGNIGARETVALDDDALVWNDVRAEAILAVSAASL